MRRAVAAKRARSNRPAGALPSSAARRTLLRVPVHSDGLCSARGPARQNVTFVLSMPSVVFVFHFVHIESYFARNAIIFILE